MWWGEQEALMPSFGKSLAYDNSGLFLALRDAQGREDGCEEHVLGVLGFCKGSTPN